jgi:hypothetical protein
MKPLIHMEKKMNPFGPLTWEQKFYLREHGLKIDRRMTNEHQQDEFLRIKERVRIGKEMDDRKAVAHAALVEKSDAALKAHFAARHEKKAPYKKIRWTPETVRAMAALSEAKTRNGFRRFHRGAFSAACRMGLMQELFPIYRRFPLVMPDPSQRMVWTEQAVRKVAGDFAGRRELNAAHGGAYRAAKRLGLLDELFPPREKINKSSQSA